MALIKEPVENQRCADCGQAFHCGIASDSPCWCATDYPASMPLTDTQAGCYCRECLEKRIAVRKSVT